MFRLIVVLSYLIALNNVDSANILGVFMAPSISHQIVYQPLWKELSLRGHKVTVITPNPLKDPSLTNLTEIDIKSAYDIKKNIKIENIMSKDASIFQLLVNMLTLKKIIYEEELKSAPVQEFLSQDRHFDLIFTDCTHPFPVMYALSAKYKAPIIGVTSMGAYTVNYDLVGNPSHPILFPDMMIGLTSENLTIWEKIKSILYGIWQRVYYYYFVVPSADQMVKKYIGKDLPYVGDLEKNMSMLFLNVNPLLYPARPNVPAIVEMGLMHIKPVKPLPTDLKKIMDEAKEGVVYFSLGSNAKSVNLNEKQREAIVQALAELPYKVLWKWESDHLPGQPKNVVIRKWLPQQDILAHPNIKVFVTQGGLQSFEEAVVRGVPLVALPFMGDQPMNVKKIVKLGLGIGLDPATMTKEEFKRAIIEVAEDAKYKNKIQEARHILYDKPMTGLEKAVWWSEYVIRHKGAPNLRSPMADISWTEYLLLDVFFVVFVLPAAIIYTGYKILI